MKESYHASEAGQFLRERKKLLVRLNELKREVLALADQEYLDVSSDREDWFRHDGLTEATCPSEIEPNLDE